MERLLVEMILDGRLRGHIDQLMRHLVLQPAQLAAEDQFLDALGKWAGALTYANESFSNRLVC